jgi:hypothetical protein
MHSEECFRSCLVQDETYTFTCNALLVESGTGRHGKKGSFPEDQGGHARPQDQESYFKSDEKRGLSQIIHVSNNPLIDESDLRVQEIGAGIKEAAETVGQVRPANRGGVEPAHRRSADSSITKLIETFDNIARRKRVSLGPLTGYPMSTSLKSLPNFGSKNV